jgi:hypothetical protein
MSAKVFNSPIIWFTCNFTLNFLSKEIILPNTDRNETDLVYNFYKIATVVLESENNDTWRSFSVGPSASRAIYTTLSSLNVICLTAWSMGHSPDNRVSLFIVPK